MVECKRESLFIRVHNKLFLLRYFINNKKNVAVSQIYAKQRRIVFICRECPAWRRDRAGQAEAVRDRG